MNKDIIIIIIIIIIITYLHPTLLFVWLELWFRILLLNLTEKLDQTRSIKPLARARNISYIGTTWSCNLIYLYI